MLGVVEAREVISQLEQEQFLCNDNLITTKDYVIVKKSGKVTTDRINEAIIKIKSEK